jgi:hypothetical protein
MAKPIKETPILYGDDALRFEARMKEPRQVSEEEKNDIIQAYTIGMAMMERGKKRNKQQQDKQTIFLVLTFK